MAEIPKAFNSEEYSFSDVQVAMLGRTVIGLNGVKYSIKQVKTNVKGAGRKPVARSRGEIDYEGSIKVLLSEVRALLQSQGSPANGLVSVKPFDIVVVYAPEVGDSITTDILKYAEFTEQTIDINQGDPSIVVELPIIIGDIKFNV